MKLLDDVQKSIDSLFNEDRLVYLLIAGVVLMLFLIGYGVYLLLFNVIVPMF